MLGNSRPLFPQRKEAKTCLHCKRCFSTKAVVTFSTCTKWFSVLSGMSLWWIPILNMSSLHPPVGVAQPLQMSCCRLMCCLRVSQLANQVAERQYLQTLSFCRHSHISLSAVPQPQCCRRTRDKWCRRHTQKIHRAALKQGLIRWCVPRRRFCLMPWESRTSDTSKQLKTLRNKCWLKSTNGLSKVSTKTHQG